MRALPIVFVTLLAGCGPRTGTGSLPAAPEAPDPIGPEPAAAPAPEPEPAPSATDLDADAPQWGIPAARNFPEHMGVQLRYALSAQRALIAGDLEGSRAQAGKLVELAPPPDLPDAWRPYLAEVKETAAVAAKADDPVSLGQQVAAIAQTCGSCHEAVGGGPPIDVAAVPEQAWDEDLHMPRHAWAADWMWIGLFAPSDEAWKRGASDLAGQEAWDGLVPDGFDLEEQVHTVAREAVETTDSDRRTYLYGQLLSSCAACHRALGEGP